jgi:hypothetical protein
MIRARHELKYWITEAQSAAVVEYMRPYMRPDGHSTTGQYPLVSLYLDTRDLLLCRQSLDGIKNRYKLRIRSYSDDPGAPCYFEIKRRINQIIVKTRVCVPRCAMMPLLNGDRPPFPGNEEDRQNLEQFLFYQQQVRARPVMRVRYLRQAFESRFDDDVRVTLDRELGFNVAHAPELLLDGSGWQRASDQGVILEIKFTHGYPMWTGRLVREFGLRPQSISKYARSVTQAREMRLCPVTQPGNTRGERRSGQ